MYSKPKKIGPIEIKNRFVRSATFEGMATEEGYVTDQLVELYKTLAKGGVGLIITGYSYIQESGKAFDKQMGVTNDDYIPGLSRIAEIVHKNGDDCKVALQIAHCGRQSRFLENTIAPSALEEKLTRKIPREMTIDEIRDTVDAFSQAIRRAKEAGFDAVQLHGAHGYLITQFLSPYINKRTDEYGGSIENRTRFLEEIYNKSVELVGKEFPIFIKMNGVDFIEGGTIISESTEVARRLENIGYAAIEVSAGIWEVAKLKKKDLGWKPTFLPESRMFIGTLNEPAYNLTYAKEFKKVLDIPIILIGGINSLDLVEQILTDDSADFVSFSRPLIREPNLPNRWMKGIGNQKVDCIFCNGCLATTVTPGLRCAKLNESSAGN
ncbi:MAG: NADH:flavin oxidoreductase [Candidatus Lokiarchaeota archaeon]|nr:NADH:flavin oxidoreductase [Candidatus Lokiarchaeota archaeon]